MKVAVPPAVGGAIMAALLAFAMLWVAGKLVRKRSSRLPPGPWGLPVLGNLLQLAMAKELPHRALLRLSNKYGPILFLRLGTTPTIVVSDSAVARACLNGRNETVFVGRPTMQTALHLAFSDFPGVGMSSYGDAWRHARKVCTLGLFTARRVREFESIRSSEIMALLRRLKQQAGQPVNLSRALSSMAEDAMCRILLGRPIREIVDAKLGVDMRMLLRNVSDLFLTPMIGDFIPTLGFMDRARIAKVDAIRNTFDTLILSHVIHESQQRSPGSSELFVDALLQNLSVEEAKTLLLELMVASMDTASTTLDWAMAELVGDQKSMTTLQMELEEVTKGERRMIKEDDLDNLVYLRAVVKETLRLHTPGPLTAPHMSMKECQVENYTIPKGTTMIVNLWAIGRDPKNWKDPDKFMPERFLDKTMETMDFGGKHPEFMPFGSGRRICPGMPLALPLIYSTIANLIHCFEWTLPPSQSINYDEHFGLVVTRADPLMVIPKAHQKF